MSIAIPAAALDQHIAILGKTGSGKTFAAKGIVEHLLSEKRQVCVIDPTSAWWGIRLGANGKSAGFNVVLLGGKHGDLPLVERSGKAVARLVTEQGASVVLDTSGMTVGEYTRWFIDFAGTLYTTIKSPLHLVIDEAHYFMPQSRTLSVDGGRMLHAGNRLMSGGRSLGIRGMMITQRPAKLHKDSLTCADTLIAMKMVAPQDRAAVKEWIDGAADPRGGKEVIESLAELPRGEGWVWYPEGKYLVRTKFPPIITFDSSATPKHGQKAGPQLGTINLDAVKASLAEAVREAEANDPSLLRAEIAKLRAELAKRPGTVVETKVIEVPTIDKVTLAKVETLTKELQEATNNLYRGLAKLPHAKDMPLDGRELVKSATRIEQPVKRIPPSPPSANGTLNSGQQRILDTIAMLQARGIDVNRDSVARWMQLHPKGGTYGTNLGALRSAGYLEGWDLTDLGSQLARPTMTGVDAALAALENNGQRDILKTVMEYKALTKEGLAAALGLHPKGGTFGTNLGRLRTMGLITERGPIAPTPGLFA